MRRSWVAAVVLGLGACGGGASPEQAAPAPRPTLMAGLEVIDDGDAALPVTVVDASGTEVTVASTDRILAANGDLAEVVYALGLGDQVVARDVSATFPPEVESLPSVGYQRTLPLEPIAALDPSVVLATTEAGPPETIAGLRSLGIPVVVVAPPDDLSGPTEKIRAVAAALGAADRGTALADQVEAEIAAATSAAAEAEGTPRVAALYLRGEAVQLLFGPGSKVSVLLEAARAHDVGAELGVDDTQPVNLEALLAARPDALVVTDSGLASVGGMEGLMALGGGALARTPAGEQGRILVYDDQMLLGFGPRTGTVLAQLVNDLHSPTAEAEADAVAEAWTTVFDSSAPIDTKAPFLQDAAAHRATLEAYADAGDQVGGITLAPSAVVVDGDQATVTYDVRFAGTEAYGDQTGTAVRNGGTWLVPTDAFCRFMAASRTPCP